MMPQFFIAAGVVGLIALIPGIAFISFRNKYLKYKDAKSTPIKHITEGLVKVQGTVYPRKVIISPISGTKCVYYDYYIRSILNWGKQKHVTKILEGKTTKPIFLFDNTGFVKINLKDAQYGFEPQVLQGADTMVSLTESMRQYLKKIDYLKSRKHIIDSIQVMERIIEPEDTLLIYGKATKDPTPSKKDQNYVMSSDNKIGELKVFQSEEEAEHFFKKEQKSFIVVLLIFLLICLGLMISGFMFTL